MKNIITSWDSPIAVSIFLLCLGGFIYLLSLSKELSKFESVLISVGVFLFMLSLGERIKNSGRKEE